MRTTVVEDNDAETEELYEKSLAHILANVTQQHAACVHCSGGHDGEFGGTILKCMVLEHFSYAFPELGKNS